MFYRLLGWKETTVAWRGIHNHSGVEKREEMRAAAQVDTFFKVKINVYWHKYEFWGPNFTIGDILDDIINDLEPISTSKTNHSFLRTACKASVLWG